MVKQPSSLGALFFSLFRGKWLLLQPNKAEPRPPGCREWGFERHQASFKPDRQTDKGLGAVSAAEKGPNTPTLEAHVQRRTEHGQDSSKSRLGQLRICE